MSIYLDVSMTQFWNIYLKTSLIPLDIFDSITDLFRCGYLKIYLIQLDIYVILLKIYVIQVEISVIHSSRNMSGYLEISVPGNRFQFGFPWNEFR